MRVRNVITADPETLGGTPVFSGTRVPVSSLLQHLKAGETLDEFLEGFPSVTRHQAEQALDLLLEAIPSRELLARAA